MIALYNSLIEISNSLIEINFMLSGAIKRERSFTAGCTCWKGIQDYFCFLGRIITIYFSSNGQKEE